MALANYILCHNKEIEQLWFVPTAQNPLKNGFGDAWVIGNIYKKYSRYIKMDTKDLIKEKIFKDYLYNKPVTYLPYDVLD